MGGSGRGRPPHARRPATPPTPPSCVSQFANFGPNATTFILPAELFATKYRATLHGISSASGKLGAIIGAFGVGALIIEKGSQVALGVLAAVCFLGMCCTVFVPETAQMTLDDSSMRSQSPFARAVLKATGQQPHCPHADNPYAEPTTGIHHRGKGSGGGAGQA